MDEIEKAAEDRTRLVVSQDEYDYINGIITANDVIIIEGITFVKRERVIEMLGKFATEHCADIQSDLTRANARIEELEKMLDLYSKADGQ